jgi:type IV pilus assembly protein PilA
VTDVDVAGTTAGAIEATYGNDANAAISGDILIISAITHEGSIQWTCKSSTIADKYLPTNCR